MSVKLEESGTGGLSLISVLLHASAHLNHGGLRSGAVNQLAPSFSSSLQRFSKTSGGSPLIPAVFIFLSSSHLSLPCCPHASILRLSSLRRGQRSRHAAPVKVSVKPYSCWARLCVCVNARSLYSHRHTEWIRSARQARRHRSFIADTFDFQDQGTVPWWCCCSSQGRVTDSDRPNVKQRTEQMRSFVPEHELYSALKEDPHRLFMFCCRGVTRSVKLNLVPLTSSLRNVSISLV